MHVSYDDAHALHKHTHGRAAGETIPTYTLLTMSVSLFQPIITPSSLLA